MSDDTKLALTIALIVVLLVGLPGLFLVQSRADACQALDWEHYRGSLCIDSDGYVRKP